MTSADVPPQGLRLRRLLDQLIQEQGLEPGGYAYFFTSGEGQAFPGSTPDAVLEETSGFVIDREGRIFSFWLEWDAERQRAVLSEWEQVSPEQHWLSEPEYLRARELVGLPAPCRRKLGRHR